MWHVFKGPLEQPRLPEGVEPLSQRVVDVGADHHVVEAPSGLGSPMISGHSLLNLQ
jgi:hypothetical protein